MDDGGHWYGVNDRQRQIKAILLADKSLFRTSAIAAILGNVSLREISSARKRGVASRPRLRRIRWASPRAPNRRSERPNGEADDDGVGQADFALPFCPFIAREAFVIRHPLLG